MRTTTISRLLAVACLSTAWTAVSFGQRDDPGFVPGQRGDLGLIREATTSFSSDRTVTVTVENGVRTLHIAEGNLKASIGEDSNEQITMRITRQYGPDQLGQLMESQPELYMYLKSIPTEFGDSKIELSVGVTREYEASGVEDLRERFPEAYEIYERFSKMQAVDMPERGFFLRDGEALIDGQLILRIPDKNKKDDKSKHRDEKDHPL